MKLGDINKCCHYVIRGQYKCCHYVLIRGQWTGTNVDIMDLEDKINVVTNAVII